MFEEGMRSAAVYTRISAADGSKLGVQRQAKDCIALAGERGWLVSRVYADIAVSASTGEPRPEYEEMLQAIREGHHDGVIVWDLDRLHRRPAELEEFIDLADRYGIHLASVDGEVDLSTPQGRFVARVKGALARAEAENISRRIRRKQLELAEAGLVSSGGIRPYGYTDDRMHIVIEEAEVICEVARRVLDGESLRGIAHDLDRRGIATIRGRPWSTRSLRDILLRPRTAGLRQYQGRVIGDAVWPAILDRATWEAVHAILTNPLRRPPDMTNVHRHLLSGIVSCGVCRKPLVSHHDTRTEGAYLSYVCRERGCRKIRVSARHLDDVVARLVLDKLERDSTNNKEDEQIDHEINGVEARLGQVTDEFADDPDVSPDQLRRITRRLRAQLEELYARRADQVWSTVLGGVEPCKLREQWNELPLARRRAIIFKATKGSLVVYPTSRRGPGFDPSRVDVLAWRQDKKRSKHELRGLSGALPLVGIGFAECAAGGGEALSEGALGELAGGGLRQLIGELNTVGEPPSGELVGD
jgi:DNA invertase Pin-like site-specific DNA recombinase